MISPVILYENYRAKHHPTSVRKRTQPQQILRIRLNTESLSMQQDRLITPFNSFSLCNYLIFLINRLNILL